ncbi:BH0509 family protein [Gracilibacillus oryzae]|uniref:BH0509 family protein n=1 Tax=Gracilibacillus oryzae TaxID=1672701 RepID=A0A7C8GSE5_9BACI|nr:BH0509 family protein [Gracilibacillus oryzae]KAB8130754.1 BH0509 family protein [Gracilibacillus oryzae]
MTQIERNDKMQLLLDKNKFNKETLYSLTDEQIEYYHWLYFEESVYDYM